MSYSVENKDGCTIVYGSVPMSVMGAIMKSAGKDQIMSFELQNILGASMVFGNPKNLERLKTNSPKPEIPIEFRKTLGEGASKWVESGLVGSSSNFMLFAFTGFNALAWLKHGNTSEKAKPACPRDADDLSRCRLLLEAEPRFNSRLPELASVSSTWKALVDHWDKLCLQMDAESPNWRTPGGFSSTPKTYALMRELTEAAV